MNSTCKTSNGSTKLGESRIQAVLLSLENGIVVVIRISPRTTGKADALQAVEGSSPVLSVQDSVLNTIRRSYGGHQRPCKTERVQWIPPPKVMPRQVYRTPPGSENGACIYGDNSGTWESQLSPYFEKVLGDQRRVKEPEKGDWQS